MTDSPTPDEIMAVAAIQNNHTAIDNGYCPFEVAGAELVADPSGVVWWQDERCLIVSDLHLEKGSSFARRGQLLPPYDTATTLARLQDVIDCWQPRTIIALGDSFHDRSASSRLPQACRQQLSAMCKVADWVWISGNHDPEPPVDLAGLVVDQLAIGPLYFCHEPAASDPPGAISGHLHPAAKIRRQGRSIRRRCFAVSPRRAILPAFGAYTGGLSVLDRAFDGLFEGRSFHALMVGDSQVYRVAGQNLS